MNLRILHKLQFNNSAELIGVLAYIHMSCAQCLCHLDHLTKQNSMAKPLDIILKLSYVLTYRFGSTICSIVHKKNMHLQ